MCVLRTAAFYTGKLQWIGQQNVGCYDWLDMWLEWVKQHRQNFVYKTFQEIKRVVTLRQEGCKNENCLELDYDAVQYQRSLSFGLCYDTFSQVVIILEKGTCKILINIKICFRNLKYRNAN